MEDCLTKANWNTEENTVLWGKNYYTVTQELLLAFSGPGDFGKSV